MTAPAPRALLVGGNGFVGGHLAHQLRDRYHVVQSGREADIRSADKVRRLIIETSPRLVVVLAALTTVRETIDDPCQTYEVGLLGVHHVFTALAAEAFQGRVLFVSSSEVYGFPQSNELPLRETAPLRPMSPYSVAKVAGEMLCYHWQHRLGLDIVVARPFTHIGPGQSTRFSVARFAHQIAGIVRGRREPILHVGNLDTTRDLTDVRDVVRAYDLLLHRGDSGAVYNVCSGREVSMRSVVEKLIASVNFSIEISCDPDLTRGAESLRIYGNYDELRVRTGWQPQIRLDTTLKDILHSALAKDTAG